MSAGPVSGFLHATLTLDAPRIGPNCQRRHFPYASLTRAGTQLWEQLEKGRVRARNGALQELLNGGQVHQNQAWIPAN